MIKIQHDFLSITLYHPMPLTSMLFSNEKEDRRRENPDGLFIVRPILEGADPVSASID